MSSAPFVTAILHDTAARGTTLDLAKRPRLSPVSCKPWCTEVDWHDLPQLVAHARGKL